MKTGRPVRFEPTEQTRQAIDDYIRAADKKSGEHLFVGRRGGGQCMTTRQYARLVSEWIASIGLDPLKFGTHSLSSTKATLIYRRTGNLARFNCYSGISAWRAQCATSASRSMTRWRSPNKLMSEIAWAERWIALHRLPSHRWLSDVQSSSAVPSRLAATADIPALQLRASLRH
jgi:hypothetical protein